MYWERRLQEEAFRRALAEERERDVEMQPVENLQETAVVAELLAQLIDLSANADAPPPIDASLAPTLLLPSMPSQPDAAQGSPQPHSHCILQTLPSQSPTQSAAIDPTGWGSGSKEVFGECSVSQPIGANSNANASRESAIDHSCEECEHASIERAGVSSWAHALPAGVVCVPIAELEMSDGELGKGSFGVVKRALWTNRNAAKQKQNQEGECAAAQEVEPVEVAVKLLHLEEFKKRGQIQGAGSELELFVRELRVMAALGTHPNLVQLYGYARILKSE